MKSLAVIGAGITGITTAYALLKRGYQVTVIDQNPYPAMMTSYANGGQLSASNAEVWNNWATIFKGARWMARRDAPLLLSLKPSWHKYSWLAEFLAATRHYQANTKETVKLALLAREKLFAVAREEAIEFDHEPRGILHFYKSGAAFRNAQKGHDLMCSAGLERYAVSGAEAKKIEPALSGDIVGGYYTESDSTGDIHKFTRGLSTACERLGATMWFERDAHAIERTSTGVRVSLRYGAKNSKTEQVSFDGVVICGGVASRRLASQLGDRLNVYPVKGYSITVPVPADGPSDAAPWVSLLDDDAKIVTSRLGVDRYRVAGTAEINGFNRDIRIERIAPLVNWVRKHHPKLDTSGTIPWAGLRPMMPDMMPRMRAGKHKGVFYNTGHGHLGWTLSAATADILASIVEETFSTSAVSKPRAATPTVTTQIRTGTS